MSALQDARRMLEEAEHAATAGYLASADELLRDAARIQEAELGPHHPDLANTLNNLAIVAERTGRHDDAERFYRRAAAIAAVSLPPDHPMVTASRENLEDFCHAAGLPIDAPAFMTLSEQDTELGLGVFANEEEAEAEAGPEAEPEPEPVTERPTVVGDNASLAMKFATLDDAPLSLAAEPPPPPRRASRSFAWVAIGVAILASAALVVGRAWSSREPLVPSLAEPSSTPQAAAPASPVPAEPRATPAPREQTQPPTEVAPSDDRTLVTDPSSAMTSADGLSLATVQLCRSLSTSGGSWRCDPAGESMPSGPLVLYTRVRSPRDAVVVHNWYRGDTLQRSVQLTIRASANEGYRTFSRRTVDDGDWRVEVRNANGDLLHEQRFVVQ